MFKDREEAGVRLAESLRFLKDAPRVLVLAIPRGGAILGKEVAARLNAPLDLVVVRKIGAPSNPEFAIGSVSQDGDPVVDLAVVRSLGVTGDYIREQSARESAEVRRRLSEYRGSRHYPELEGRTVVIVDDGMATGDTALAAALSVKRRGAEVVVVAVPVASREAVEKVASAVDRVVCLETPARFLAIGEFYRDFSQVSDEAVRVALRTAGPRP